MFTPEELGVSPQIFFKITLSEVVAQLSHEERGRDKRSDGAHYTLEQKGDVVFQSPNAAGGEEKVLPPSRTNWTRLVPPSVLTEHV